MSASTEPHQAPGVRKQDFAVWIPTALLVALFWLLIFNQQRLEWTVNAVYSYGWAVPALALFLFWERWRRRPAIERPGHGALLVLAAVLLLAYLPIRVIQEANPDWVKINWMMAGLSAGLSLLAVSLIGGVRYGLFFAFPILFCFSALPWPVWMETSLIQHLMRGNASICAEILTMFGMPAMAEGNLIQVADHWVNVEEACSGIRSLQTAFMMSLFLGEFHRLSVIRRGGLMIASFAVAFFVNLLRTLLLTYLTAHGSADKWHDTVGNVSMVLCLVALWGISEWFRPKAETLEGAKALDPILWAPFPVWFAAAGCLWLTASEGMTRYWYSSHEKRIPPPIAWHVEWPEQARNFRVSEFPERTFALLKYNRGGTASWIADAGYPFQMYYLDWDPGRVSKFLSSSHYPEVCLPATGMTLVSRLGVWDCELEGLQIPFATSLFDDRGSDVYVFHAIIEDRPLKPGEHFTYRQVTSSERLTSVMNGERNLGQHVIGIALRGATSPSDAREIVVRVLKNVIRPGVAPTRTPKQT